MFIATVGSGVSAPAERYVIQISTHSTPMECYVSIMFSINIALRWSAAFSRGTLICETHRKIEVPLKTQLSLNKNCPDFSVNL